MSPLDPRAPLGPARCLLLAGVLVALQVSVAVGMAPSDRDPDATYRRVAYPSWWREQPPDFTGVEGRYLRLLQWDALHYVSIARSGYRLSDPPLSRIHDYEDTVAFFPGFPLAGRLVHALTGASHEVALLLAAQLMAVACWTYLLLFLRAAGLTAGRAVGAALLVAAFPTSFYLVVGYAESTFIAGVLGLCYWYGRARERSGVPGLALLALAAGHGAVVTGTRLVGLPLVLVPLLYEAGAGWHGERPRWRLALAAGALALLGAAAFFGWLELGLGDWQLHFEAQRRGWGNRSEPGALVDWRTYLPRLDGGEFGDDLSRVLVPTFVVVFAALLWQYATRWRPLLRVDAPLLYAALTLFVAAAVGRRAVHYTGMVRYVLPCVVLLACVRPRLVEAEPLRRSWMVLGAAAAGLVIQLALLRRFLHGDWVG